MHLQYLVNKHGAQSLAPLATGPNRAFTAKVTIQLNALLAAGGGVGGVREREGRGGGHFHSLAQSQALKAL